MLKSRGDEGKGTLLLLLSGAFVTGRSLLSYETHPGTPWVPKAGQGGDLLPFLLHVAECCAQSLTVAECCALSLTRV